MRLRRRPVVLPAALLAALVVGGCMASGMGPMGPGMHGTTGNAAQAPSPMADAPELVVMATEFRFDPSELRLRAGVTVNLTLDDRGRLYHDLTIEDLGFVLTADAGARSSGALAIPQPGRYRFLCSVPGHAEAGMFGTLVVD